MEYSAFRRIKSSAIFLSIEDLLKDSYDRSTSFCSDAKTRKKKKEKSRKKGKKKKKKKKKKRKMSNN